MPRWTLLFAPVLAAALVLIATRHDPLLSPDSITYLSVAKHIREGHGLTDFTGKPLAVFGPVYPLLLAAGGRSLAWATVVGVASIAVGSALMGALLHRRARPIVALAGALAFGASQGFVHMASVVWTEAPYAAIALATLVVLKRNTTTRTLALAGLLAGLGFLTRYAGAGAIATGAVMVAASAWRTDQREELGVELREELRIVLRRDLIKQLAIFLATAAGVISLWIVRNLIETGQPLGPRFEGGVDEPLSRTIHLAFVGTGHIVVGDGWSEAALDRIGTVVVLAIVVLMALALPSRRATSLDLAMAAFAATSFVLPIVARVITANDIELRVMSPMLIPLIYFTSVTFDRFCTTRVVAIAGAGLLGWWVYQGAAFAVRFPDLAPGGAGYKAQFAPKLYDAIDSLPHDARVLTNNPQRVWWFTNREPTFMGFTTPRPGNSHYPLDAEQTLHEACSGHSYLAWFDSLQNGGATPQQRRPDLAALVDLHLETPVAGGELYRLSPHDAASC